LSVPGRRAFEVADASDGRRTPQLTQPPHFRIEILLLAKPGLNSGPVASVPPKLAFFGKTAERILVQGFDCRARDLLGDAHAADHLGVGDEKSLRSQCEQRVLQCVKQSKQKLPKRPYPFALFSHCTSLVTDCRPEKSTACATVTIIDDSSPREPISAGGFFRIVGNEFHLGAVILYAA
jgi:hypothetical protein